MKRSIASLLAIGTASVMVGGSAAALALANEQSPASIPPTESAPAAPAAHTPMSISESPGSPPGLAREIERRYASNRHPVADEGGTVRGWTTNDVIDGKPVLDARSLGPVFDDQGTVVGYYDGVFVAKEIVDRGAYEPYAATHGDPNDLSGLNAEELEAFIKRYELDPEQAEGARGQWKAQRDAKQR